MSIAPKLASVKKAFERALLFWASWSIYRLCQDGCSPPKNVGGQAVIEGVMMRGQDLWSVMVREPGGDIQGRTRPHRAWSSRKPWKFPFIRGLVVLIESLVLGVKALNYSTEISVSAKPNTSLVDKPVASADRVGRVDQTDPPQPAPFESNAPSIPQGSVQPSVNESSEKGLHPLALFFSVAMGIGLGLVLFVALPHVLSIWFGAMGGFDESTLPFHILDGLLKFAIFLAYVWLIGLIPDIARVYAYHGAEHQAIHVYEAGLPLEPLEAKQFPTWHPRCGTAFIFLVLAASILFFAIIFPLLAPFSELARFPRALAGVGLKLAFTPFLAVVAYEITKMAGKPDSGRLWQAMVWPGLILQRLTTRKPDDSMLEVAFKSLEAVIPGKN